LEFKGGVGCAVQQNRRWRAGSWIRVDTLGALPIEWDHLIGKESLKINQLEQALVEKGGQRP
jgi:hypothetical protein